MSQATFCSFECTNVTVTLNAISTWVMLIYTVSSSHVSVDSRGLKFSIMKRNLSEFCIIALYFSFTVKSVATEKNEKFNLKASKSCRSYFTSTSGAFMEFIHLN